MTELIIHHSLSGILLLIGYLSYISPCSHICYCLPLPLSSMILTASARGTERTVRLGFTLCHRYVSSHQSSYNLLRHFRPFRICRIHTTDQNAVAFPSLQPCALLLCCHVQSDRALQRQNHGFSICKKSGFPNFCLLL